jgi:hypothetical protein
MPLMSLWSSNQSAISEFSVEQVVATAGDGNLRDKSICSEELRAYFAEIPIKKLASYVDQCLNSHFLKSGFVLQDLVNELGRRIEYKVTNGRYQGVPGAVGFDGLWVSPEGHSLLVEVKTTDTYRVSLDTIEGYRHNLLDARSISAPSSILIIVGRQDTGELEAQVRGSRHAWDIRLISADALMKLVNLKENVEGIEAGQKIRTLLIPREYTRLDDMIDVMFTTAKDVANVAESDTVAPEDSAEETTETLGGKSGWEFTDSTILQAKRDAIIAAIGKREGTALIKRSRALYWSAGHDVRTACTISKRYTKTGVYRYWYAYHPQWDQFLGEGARSYFVLGCVDLDFAFAIPLAVLRAQLPGLNTTVKEDGSFYHHLHLAELSGGKYALNLPKKAASLPLSDFTISLG